MGEEPMNKEIRELIRVIEAKGFTVARENGRYYKVRNQDGGLLYALPATPGRARWLKNLTSELRKRGIID